MKRLKRFKLPIIIILSVFFGRWTMTNHGEVATHAMIASVVDMFPGSEVQ